MYQDRERQIDKGYRIQNLETDPDMYQKVLCNTCVLTNQSGAMNYPTNGPGRVGFPYVGNIRYPFLPYTPTNIKFNKYLKGKIKTYREKKNLKEKTTKLYDFEEKGNFLNGTQ